MWEGGGGGGCVGSNRLPGLVTKQQAVEFPQVQTIVYNNLAKPCKSAWNIMHV